MEGFGIVFQSIMRSHDLPIEAKGIYAYLAAMGGRNGQAFPSVLLMCEELGIGKNRFYKNLGLLISAGAVSKSKKNGHIYYTITDGRDSLKMRLQETPTVSKRDSESLNMRLQQSQNRNLKITDKKNNENYINTGDELYEKQSDSLFK